MPVARCAGSLCLFAALMDAPNSHTLSYSGLLFAVQRMLGQWSSIRSPENVGIRELREDQRYLENRICTAMFSGTSPCSNHSMAHSHELCAVDIGFGYTETSWVGGGLSIGRGHFAPLCVP